MRVAIISDTHFGYGNDSQTHLDHMVRFFDRVFFPELRTRRVDRVVHLGDLVDRRKYVNFKTAETMRTRFLQPLADLNLETHVICGNHDVTYRNTNETNALRELVRDRYPLTRIYTNPAELDLGGRRAVLLPWVCDANRESAMSLLEGSTAPLVMGHLELNGFKMYKTSGEMDHGMDPGILRRFDVFTGHFHHRSLRDRIMYVGAPYEMNWSDWDDERGFHVLDTDSGDLEFVQNPYTLHRKIFYADGAFLDGDLQGQVVKVVVKSRDDGAKFDDFIKELESHKPADVQVVDDHLNMHLEPTDDEEGSPASAEDTPSILTRAVDEVQLSDGVDRSALSSLLLDVYQEAVSRR